MKYFRWWVIFLGMAAIVGILSSPPARAAGTSGLTYETYRAPCCQSPSINPLTYPTVLSTGISSSINYSPGSFGATILGSGRADQVIVKWTGYINLQTSGTYYFGANADDGFIVNINGTDVVHSWIDSGNAFRSGPGFQFAAGVYPITVWYYENGGGQAITFQYWTGTQWMLVPSSMLATDATYWAAQAPVLCCGGSSTAFVNTPANTAKVAAYKNRTTADNQVYIEQLGNSNTITVEQTGTKNNYAEYYGNGSGNTVNIKQSATVPTAVNYVEMRIVGNTNTATITQQNAGGEKSAFVTVNDSNNSVLLTQKDSGNHYAEVSLSGGSKNVDILQQGSGNHQAKVGLTGLPVDLSLTQSGSTQQSYSINFNCATAGGCQKITVSQGQ